jgi:hypothetical protein
MSRDIVSRSIDAIVGAAKLIGDAAACSVTMAQRGNNHLIA